jgi:hypothetical protein
LSQRNHPDYYYAIRDAVIARMGPVFNVSVFQKLFPKGARPHHVIPYTDGYLAHRRIIQDLVKSKMQRTLATVPKEQLRLTV